MNQTLIKKPMSQTPIKISQDQIHDAQAKIFSWNKCKSMLDIKSIFKYIRPAFAERE